MPISQNQIEQTIAFHGHSCPGLAIGIRAAELCLSRIGHNDDADVLCVTETDMCGVDAIQFLTGCTFGKGNLIHRDHGKSAFTFYGRKDGTAFRAVLRKGVGGAGETRIRDLMPKVADGTATEEEKQLCAEHRKTVQRHYLEAPLDELFTVTSMEYLPPRRASILQSLTCDACGESTMESRTRNYAGETLCIPCFGKVEQKI